MRALVRAGACRECATGAGMARVQMRHSMGALREARRKGFKPSSTRRFSQQPHHSQSAAVAASTEEPGGLPGREDYEDLVDTYDSFSDISHRRARGKLAHSAKPSGQRSDHLTLAPRLVMTAEQEERLSPRTRRVAMPGSEALSHRLQLLRKLLSKSPGHDPDKIWSQYQELPTPRLQWLRDREIRRLFLHLSWVEAKNLTNSQRFFSLIEECSAEQVSIQQYEWNTAISFAGRWVRRITTDQVRAAVETWMRMENAGVQAEHVTFNILFDVAIRAGRYALADTIHHELKARGLPLDRYCRTAMIYYAGLRRNGDAVRQAFRDLVNAGEIVDTAVMNCVILSLVRSGEAASAENTFAKMKHLHGTKFGAKGPRNWVERKRLGIRLNRTADKLRIEQKQHESSFFGGTFASNDQKEQAQLTAPIHPDARTCQILIKYHALKSGDLARIRELMKETTDGGYNIQGGVYSLIFRGFWLHGGHAFSAWNRMNLDRFWFEFLDAAYPRVNVSNDYGSVLEGFSDSVSPEKRHCEDDEDGPDETIPTEDRPPSFKLDLARRVIYAFYKCVGRHKMLEIWNQIQDRWKDMGADDQAALQEIVSKLAREDGVYVDSR